MKVNEVALVKSIQKNYNIGHIDNLELIKTSLANKNYLIITKKNKYIVRILYSNIFNQLNNMPVFLQYAKKENLPFPRILLSINKSTYINHGKRKIILMSYIEGKQITLETITLNKIKSLAIMLANFHQLKCTLPYKSKSLTLNYVLDYYEQYLPKIINSQFPGKKQFLKSMASEYKILNNTMPIQFSNLPKGIVHNDPTPWNVLFKEDKISALLDFESVGISILLLDLARAINIWCFENNKLNKKRLDIFLKSYMQSRPLTNYEKECLPSILRFVAFRHCCYFIKFFIDNKKHIPTKSIDYDCLQYYQSVGNKDLYKQLFN